MPEADGEGSPASGATAASPPARRSRNEARFCNGPRRIAIEVCDASATRYEEEAKVGLMADRNNTPVVPR